MIEYFVLLLAIPLGIIASKFTQDERNIWGKSPYFPIFVWVLALLVAIFLTLDKTTGLALAFMGILVFTWWKA